MPPRSADCEVERKKCQVRECLAQAQVTNQGLWSAFQGGRLLAVCFVVSDVHMPLIIIIIIIIIVMLIIILLLLLSLLLLSLLLIVVVRVPVES